MIETNNVEFKRELNDKLEKEMISFLNSNGGHIFIGINDDGSTYGVSNIDELQLIIKDRIKDKIAPSPIGFFELIAEIRDGKDVLHIIVASGNEKPYYIKKYGMCPQGAYTRIGSACVQLTEKQIFDLFSRRTRTSLTNIVSPIQALTFTQLKIYYSEIGYEFSNNTYKQLNFQLDGGQFNYLAYLLSDQNSLVFNIGKFKGNDVVILEEMKSFSNQSLIKTTHEIVDYFDKQNRNFTEITSSKRKENSLFDPIAMREALINAIVHSDYTYENVPTFRIFDDHIEIISVGGLPEGLEKDEFLNGYMSPKNPQLMKVFRDLGFVEHMGTGIIRILNKYDKSVFHFSTNFIKVSIPFNMSKIDDFSNNEITDRQKKIISLIEHNKNITQDEIANQIKVSRATIIREIKKLEDKSIIRRIGSNKNGNWEVI